MFNSNRLTVLAFALAMIGFAGPAASQSVSKQVSDINELAAIAEAKKKLAEMVVVTPADKKEKEATSAVSAVQSVRAAQQEPEESLPLIAAIEGANGKMTAVLNLGQGQQQVVKTGSVIRNGWRVDLITINAIVISRASKKGKDRELVQLSFGEAPASAQTPASSSGFGMPNRPTVLPTLPR